MGFLTRSRRTHQDPGRSEQYAGAGVFRLFRAGRRFFTTSWRESLILADLGVETSGKAVERLRKRVREDHLKTTEEAKDAP